MHREYVGASPGWLFSPSGGSWVVHPPSQNLWAHCPTNFNAKLFNLTAVARIKRTLLVREEGGRGKEVGAGRRCGVRHNSGQAQDGIQRTHKQQAGGRGGALLAAEQGLVSGDRHGGEPAQQQGFS